MRSVLAGIVTMAIAAPLAAQAPPPPPAVPSVTTQAEATIRRAPDRAYVDVQVETRAPAPRTASEQNARLMTAVQDKLGALGLPPDAVRTRAYELSPQFDYIDGKQVPRGYLARNRIEVRVDQLDRLGEAIDAAIGAGATTISSIRFDLKERQAVEREALRQAVADARARAEAAAAGAGLTIARVLKIEEGERAVVPPPIPYMAAARAEAKAMPVTPITGGEIEIRASVTLTAELK